MPEKNPKPFKHGEAFALMWYGCRDCGHRERIWNSRDGVTPFGFRCPSCGETCHHVMWPEDRVEPFHQLRFGQKFWRNGTAKEAGDIMRKRIANMKGHRMVVSDAEAAALIAQAESGADEFHPGWPVLETFNGENFHVHTGS